MVSDEKDSGKKKKKNGAVDGAGVPDDRNCLRPYFSHVCQRKRNRRVVSFCGCGRAVSSSVADLAETEKMDGAGAASSLRGHWRLLRRFLPQRLWL